MKVFTLSVIMILVLLGPDAVQSQTGHWKMVHARNTIAERNECGMAEVNGQLYLIGGDTGSPQAVESFDPKTLTWTEHATAPIVMHHFQAVGYDNKVFVLEAFSEGQFPTQEPMSGAYIYDTQKDTWEKGGELQADRRRAGAGAAVYNGKLYLVAGIQHGHSSGTTNMFDVYDPATATWSALRDAPHVRDHCSAVVIKNKLYVVGGRNTSFRDPANKITFFSQTVLDIDCYDFLTGQWSTLAARLPLGSGGGAVVNLHDGLYYMGGERATKTQPNAPRKNTYFLDPSTSNNWVETAPLHYGRNGMAAAVVNDKIYAAGGSGAAPGKPASLHHLPSHLPSPNELPVNNALTMEVFSIK